MEESPLCILTGGHCGSSAEPKKSCVTTINTISLMLQKPELPALGKLHPASEGLFHSV